MTWVLSKLRIQGIKGVLDRAGDFDISPKKGNARSLAIFGRNAHGKSGYADAVEYLFSSDGEVEHLGKGSADSEQGGKHALPHVLAEEKGIPSKVNAEFVKLETGQKTEAERLVTTGRKDARPKELDPVIQKSPAYRILRQHDLRRFVVELTPGDKFKEFARWVGLESMSNLLQYLKTAENKLKDTDVDREIRERITSIATHTSNAVDSFDVIAILDWCSVEVSKHLGQTFAIAKVLDINNALAALRAKREAIIMLSAATQKHLAKTNMENALRNFSGSNGYISKVKSSLEASLQKEKLRNQVRQEATESVFQEVWDESSKLLKSQTTTTCPVCQTPWGDTVNGSQVPSLVKSYLANFNIVS